MMDGSSIKSNSPPEPSTSKVANTEGPETSGVEAQTAIQYADDTSLTNVEVPDESSDKEGSVEDGTDTGTTIAEAVTASNLANEETSEDSSTDSDTSDSEDNIAGGGRVNVRRGFPYFRQLHSICTLMWMLNVVIAILAYFSFSSHPHSIHVKYISGPSNPIYLPLLLVPRENWDDQVSMTSFNASKFEASRVVIVQTDTPKCGLIINCKDLLNELQHQYGPLKYNFMLSTDGYVYEALGWKTLSPHYDAMPAMVVAFIGSFEKTMPSYAQLIQLKNLLSKSEEKGYLKHDFKIIGKILRMAPSKLFPFIIDSWKQWDFENSDFVERPDDIVNFTQVVDLFVI